MVEAAERAAFSGIWPLGATTFHRFQRNWEHRLHRVPTDFASQKGDVMEAKMVKELLLQSLEHEMGGVKIYQTALKCAINEDLKEEWERYLQETEKHVQV